MLKVSRRRHKPTLRLQGETFTARNASVTFLIQQSYGGLRSTAVIGGPDWISKDRFDIVAKTGRPNAPYYAMVKSLLADRFKLRTHQEQREAPVFKLVVARADRRLGPQLVPSKMDCDAWKTGPPGTPRCGFSFGRGAFDGKGTNIAPLLSTLIEASGRPVIDSTRLTALYDIKLRFEPTLETNASAPPLFTALQDQLGLKLEPDKAMQPVLVVDSVEHPTEN